MIEDIQNYFDIFFVEWIKLKNGDIDDIETTASYLKKLFEDKLSPFTNPDADVIKKILISFTDDRISCLQYISSNEQAKQFGKNWAGINGHMYYYIYKGSNRNSFETFNKYYLEYQNIDESVISFLLYSCLVFEFGSDIQVPEQKEKIDTFKSIIHQRELYRKLIKSQEQITFPIISEHARECLIAEDKIDNFPYFILIIILLIVNFIVNFSANKILWNDKFSVLFEQSLEFMNMF